MISSRTHVVAFPDRKHTRSSSTTYYNIVVTIRSRNVCAELQQDTERIGSEGEGGGYRLAITSEWTRVKRE